LEEYDFLIPRKRLVKDSVIKLIDALKHLDEVLDEVGPIFKKYFRASESSGFEKVTCFEKT